MKRTKTVAVMFTDMVNSTRLLARLGTDKALQLRHDHDEILRGTINEADGIVADTAGDGVMAIFDTPSQAVETGLTLMKRVAAYGRRASAVAEFEIRIGISVGEVVIDDDAYFGEAVVEAARLEPMAEGGEIVVSDLVRLLAGSGTKATFEGIGDVELRGLDRTTAAYLVHGPPVEDEVPPLPSELSLDGAPPYVGRLASKASLRSAWERAVQGERCTAMIGGPPGIGKSRLLAELAAEVHDEGGIVLFGACDAEFAVPYRPFTSAFAQTAEAKAERELGLQGNRGPLAPLYPTQGGLARFESHDSGRLELFEAVDRLVSGQADTAPVLLVLDDLHWATRETVLLLRYLVQQPSDVRLLIVGTYRDLEVATAHDLSNLFGELARDRRCHNEILDGLALSEVAEMFALTTGETMSDQLRALVERVYDETGGSPFFAGEVLRDLASAGLAQQQDGNWQIVGEVADLPIPASVRAVVRHRLARLGQDALDLLTTAAVVGATFDNSLLEAVTKRPSVEVLETIEAAERVSIVRAGATAGSFGFVHSIVRSTLLDEVSLTKRAAQHRLIAESLESMGATRVVELAHHWGAALGDDAHEKSVHYLIEAASLDERSLAWESAGQRYRDVIELLKDSGNESTRERAEIHLALGRTLRAISDAGYRSQMLEVGRLARRIDASDLLARAAIGCSRFGNWYVPASAGFDSEVAALCEDALASLDTEDPLRVQVLNTFAVTLAFGPEQERRRQLIVESQALAERLDDPVLIGRTLLAELLAFWDPTTFDRQLELATEIRRVARETSDLELEFLGGFLTARLKLEACDLHGCLADIELLNGPIRELRSALFEFLVERMLVGIDLMRGDPGGMTRAMQLHQRSAAPELESKATFGAHTAMHLRNKGRFAEMAPALHSFVGDGSGLSVWKFGYGVSLVDAGEIDKAVEFIEQTPDPGFDSLRLVGLQMLAEAGFKLDRPDFCRRAYDGLIDHRGRLGVLSSGLLSWQFVSVSLGQAALCFGDLDQAIEFLAEGARQADKVGAPYYQTVALRLLAQALLRRSSTGDDDAAARAISEAGQLNTDFDMPGEAESLLILSGGRP